MPDQLSRFGRTERPRTTYALTAVEADPRSIVILRGIRGHHDPDLPTQAALGRLLGFSEGG